MSSQPTIRPAVPGDGLAIGTIRVELWRTAYAGLMPAELLDGLSVEENASGWEETLSTLRPGRAVLIAEVDDRPVGFSALGPAQEGGDDRAQVFLIYLLPEVWRQGIGRRLLDASTDRLRELGYRTAMLWVLDTNLPARRFYEAMGWTSENRERIDETFGAPIVEVAYTIELGGRPHM